MLSSARCAVDNKCAPLILPKPITGSSDIFNLSDFWTQRPSFNQGCDWSWITVVLMIISLILIIGYIILQSEWFYRFTYDIMQMFIGLITLPSFIINKIFC